MNIKILAILSAFLILAVSTAGAAELVPLGAQEQQFVQWWKQVR